MTDPRAENAEIIRVLTVIRQTPESAWEELALAAARLTGADSAGISLLVRKDGHLVFVWRAACGQLKPLAGTTLPRDQSPCGIVLDHNQPLLVTNPALLFPSVQSLGVPVAEALLVPFHVRDQPVGTFWLVRHDSFRPFDAEDLRIATSLAQLASIAISLDPGQRLTSSDHETANDASDLTRLQEQARVAQARFQAFFDQSPFYAAILGADGRVIDISRIALDRCGYTRDEVIGRPFWQTGWWHGSKEVQEQVRRGFEECLRGRLFKAQLPYFFANGDERVTDFGLSPGYDGDGRISFVIATGMDITARSRAERELAVARRRLDSALIAAELGVYEWDVPTDRLYSDENLGRLFGLPENWQGAPISEYFERIHPDDRERTVRLIQKALGSGDHFEADYRILVGSVERWVNSRGKLLRDAEGRVISFVGVVLDITARKRAEEERERMASELRRLTAIHETVLSSTNDFAYIFDRQGRFLYANRPLLKIWGKTLDEVIGRTCYDLDYPEWHADMHMREIAHVIATRQPIRNEVAFTGASGMGGIFDYIFTPVFAPDGEVELVAGTTRDVTERRRTEDRDRFLVRLDDATRPLTDPQEITQTSARLLGEYLGVNRCAYADVEADENTFNLTGDYNRDVPSIVGRYRFDQFSAECLRAMRAGEPFVVEDAATDPRLEQVRESFEVTRMRSVICVSLRKANHFVAAMAVHQVSPRAWLPAEVELVQLVANRCWESIERARVTRALAESEQQLRLAVETAGLGVWDMDWQTGAVRCSEACKVMFGFAPDRPVETDAFWDAIHPEDRERVRSVLREAAEQGTKFDLEYRIRWPDGALHWLLVRGHATYGVDGKPQRVIGANLDITSRKQAESELARLHDEAVQASRAKDDFLAALSHELRTPLNPVLLLASEAAEDASLPAAARDAFGVIRRNVELEARLIDDLLDLTTIVRGKLVVRKEPVEVHPLLEQAAADLKADFAAKSIDLQLDLTATQSKVRGDGARLLQVLLNLMRNALKFTPPGGAVAIVTRQHERGELEIRVTDTGIGLTPLEIERVFEPFEQGDHAIERGAPPFGGLGLGLSIAKQLIELHHGTISAMSQGRDRGATFVVTLPVLENVPTQVEATKGLVPPPAAANRPTLRVLLVEDHEPTRMALMLLLKRRGFLVTGVGTLGEGRRCATEAEYDLLISDIGLPDGDGVMLMREMQDRFKYSGIALTGYGMASDVARSLEAGFAAHLTKPVTIRSLDGALAHTLKDKANGPG